MKETKRIREMFKEAYKGDSWVSESLMGTLEKISAERAAQKVEPRWNTIWEIVNHIISWRENVLKRVQGEVIKSPDNNYLVSVTDTSDKAWADTLQRLTKSQEEWIRFLDIMNQEDLEKIYPANKATYYKNIHGIIQHDYYHLGQIILLAK